MAKLPPQTTPIRRPSLRGRFVISSWRGLTRIQSWPKKPTSPRKPAQLQAQETFRQASIAAKAMDAGMQNWAREVSQGTQFLPRDVIYKGLYGRLFRIGLADGRTLISMAARNDVSEALDAIAQIPGSIMVRGEDFWEPLEPGPDGAVLMLEDGRPIWGTGGGGGGGAGELRTITTPASASSTYPKFPAFETAVYDDFSTFNPTFPDRFYLPDGATRFRASCNLRMTSDNANARGWFIRFEDQNGSEDFPGNVNVSYRQTASGFTSHAIQATTAWCPVADMEYIRCRLNLTPTYNSQVLAGSWVMIEIA